MGKALFKISVALIGVLVCEKIYTKGYGDGYDKGVDDSLSIVAAVTKKVRETKES